MHAVLLGASRNIGYHLLRDLISTPSNTVTLLLRSPKCFDGDTDVTPAIESGQITIVEGDGMSVDDVAKCFADGKQVDVVVSTIGSFPVVTLTGFKLPIPNLCTVAAAAMLINVAKLPQATPPRVIVVSSMGIGSQHHIMPFALRIMYSLLLAGPHRDKEGLEYLVQHASRAMASPTDPRDVPGKDILTPEKLTAVPGSFLPEVILIRPALLTDGEAKGRPSLRAGADIATYSCSRKDVAGFIATECMPGQQAWVNQGVVLGY